MSEHDVQGRSGTSVSKVETVGQRGGRRWTLYDKSDDFTPRWQVGAEPTPVANEYAEWVEVMPVAEHEAEIAAIETKLTRQHDELMAQLADLKAKLERL